MRITIEEFNDEVNANRPFAKVIEKDGFNILKIDTVFGTITEKININFKPILASIVDVPTPVKAKKRSCPYCGRFMKPTVTDDKSLSVVECKKCRYSILIEKVV